MTNSVTVSFYLRPIPKEPEYGKVYMRITVNRRKSEMYIGSKTLIANWDESKQAPKKDRKLKEELIFLEGKILELKRQLQFEERQVTSQVLKELIQGKNEVKERLISYFQKHIEMMEARPNEFSKSTLKMYRTTLKHLINLLAQQGLKDTYLHRIDFRFLNQFDHHLLTWTGVKQEKPMTRNTANKHHSRFRTILLKAFKEDFIKNKPYDKFTLKFTQSARTFLTPKEFKALEQHDLGGNQSLIRVRDLFVFATYSGLRFSDIEDLQLKHIKQDSEGGLWIEKELIKKVVGKIVSLKVPLLDKAIEIIDKYDGEHREITGKVFHEITNQKTNAYLKVIADLVGIEKNLTFHVSRHTCATTINLDNGIPLEVVSKRLGHTSIRSTQIYAKVSDNYQKSINDLLNDKLK
ncbi:MAG: integrase/recombinase XerD [Bacteroidia bacterium]|jgi:integrase/recombinase XerD